MENGVTPVTPELFADDACLAQGSKLVKQVDVRPDGFLKDAQVHGLIGSVCCGLWIHHTIQDESESHDARSVGIVLFS